MTRHAWVTVAAMAGLLTAVVSRASAQSEDDRWVRDCERSGSDAREQFCDARQTGFKPGGVNLVITPDEDGGVDVAGWDRDSVAISLRIQSGASTDEEARQLADQVRVNISGNTISVDGPSNRQGHQWSASLWIRVPHNSGLTIATTNGPIGVDTVSGTMDLRTQNGPLTLNGLAGEVRARARNGPLTVSLSGASWQGKGLDAETVNGPLTLRMPAGYNTELETGTVNGPMNLQVALNVTLHGNTRDHLHSILGKGGSPVRVVTTNGPAIILKADSER